MVKGRKPKSTLPATSSKLTSNPAIKSVVNVLPYKPIKLPRPIYTIIQKRDRVRSQPRILPLPDSSVNGSLKASQTQLVYPCSSCTDYKCTNKTNLGAHACKKLYECEICGYKTIRKASLSMHFRTHRGEKQFSCDRCSCKFLQKSLLMKHLKLHVDITPFGCNICDMKFSRNDQLLSHLKVHEEIKETSFCNDKDKKISTPENGGIKMEILVEEFQDEETVSNPKEDFNKFICVKKEPEIFEEEKFENETCRRSVYIKENPLLENPDPEDKIDPVSTNANPLSCDICSYTTSDALSLSRHLRNHTGLKPFTCDFCDFKCAMERNLTKHLKSHSVDERTRVCEVCDAKFLFKRSFEKHMSHHTNKTAFPCKVCGLRFSRYLEKVQHLTTHTAQELLTCEICGLRVSNKQELKDHLMKHKTEKYSCDTCGLKFSREYQLRSHSRVHSAIIPFECEICHLKFAEEAFLQVHIRNHTGKKPFQCRSCPMNFNREIHLRLHNVVHMTFGFGKQLTCEWCDYKCLLKGELRKHIKTHPCD